VVIRVIIRLAQEKQSDICMAISSLIPSFNGGELSPLIHLRSDLEKYRSGCRTLRNFLITPFGGVRRRSGFAHFGTATSKARVFRFQSSTDLGYILEFGEGYIRFYLNTIVLAAGGGDYTVATPYSAADLPSLQMVQINAVAYFTHPNHPPYKLTRVYNDMWEFIPVPFSVPAMRDENLNRSLTLTTSSSAQAGQYVNITASAGIFSALHVGAYFEISHERASSQFEVQLAATSGNNGLSTDGLIVQGAWSFITSGTWEGTFIIQRSVNGGGSWQEIRRFYSNLDANFSAGGSESSQVLLRVKWEHGGTGSSDPRARLEATGAFIRGVVKITVVANSSLVTVLVIEPVQAGATSYFREGAWSDYRGHPRTVTAHEGRIIYGGTASQPSTVWGSAVDDFENFRPGGVGAADPWTHVLASDQQNSIQWMVSQKSLLIGTSGDEWVMAASGQEEIISPTNVRARRHSGNGSEFLKARVVNDAVLFVQRGGKKLRDMTFSFEADGYVSNDLTLLAEHITGEGIIDTAWQSQPYGTLWCVTSDGELLGLTYDRQQQISGWSRHTTGNETDGFESVAVRATNGEKDQVWAVVRRRIDGTDRRYIERMNDDGFFLEAPWSEKFASVDGVELWEINYESFAELDVVTNIPTYVLGNSTWTDGEDYVFWCHTAHTASNGSNLTSISPNWYDAIAWLQTVPPVDTSGAAYFTTSVGTLTGKYCNHGGKVWECILGHAPDSSSALSEPGVGSSWATYWVEVADFAGSPATYVPVNAYADNDEVANHGKKYVCTSDHTPAAATEPGVGASWSTKWELQQGGYTEGDLVSSSGRNYLCTADHTPATTTQPGVGDDWGDVWDLQSTDNLRFFVDSGVTKFDFVGTELTGLDHLEGETVQVLGNGHVLPSRTVTGGAIALDLDGDPETFTSLCVGLQYDSILEPMALEIGMQSGTSTGKEKRIHEVVLYFNETSGGKVGWRVSGPFDTLPFRTGDMIADDPTPLFTGAIVHHPEARHDFDASLVIKQDAPLPMMVTAVVPNWNVYGS
jgi:hypothetical protein